jgi:hypothetical protein
MIETWRMSLLTSTNTMEKVIGSQQCTQGARTRGMWLQQLARVRVQERAGEGVRWCHGTMRGTQFGWTKQLER